MADKIGGIDVQFGADTVSFDNSIKGINKAIGIVGRDLKNLNKELRVDPKNIDTLKTKFDTLHQSIGLSEKRLAMYNDELASMKQSDIGGADWIKLKKQISDAETEIKVMSAEAKKTEKAINEIDDATIDIDATQAKKELDDLSDKAENAGQNLTKMGQGIQTVGKVVSVAGVAIAAGLASGISGASDLEEAMNAAQNQFGDFTDEMFAFTKNSATAFGETQATVLEYASAFKRVGMSNEQIQSTLQRTADIASEQNKSFGDVGDMIISVYNGSTEAGEKFGIQTKVNQLGQYLFEQGLVSSAKAGEKLVGSMSTAEKQLLMYEKIMSDTSASQGDFASNTGTLAIEAKKAEATFKELVTELSGRLLPIISPLIAKINEFMQSIMQLNDSQKDLVLKIGLLVIALGPLLLLVGKAMTVFGALQAAAAAASVTVAAFVAPVVAVVAILGALVTAVIYAYNSSETFRNGVAALISSLTILKDSVLSVLVNFYKQYLAPMFEALAKLVGTVVVDSLNALMRIINEVLMPVIHIFWNMFVENVLPILKDFATFVTTVVVPALSSLWNFLNTYVIPVVIDLWSWVASKILPILKSLASVVTGVIAVAFNIFYGVITTVIGVIGTLYNWFGQLWSQIANSWAVQSLIGVFETLMTIVDGVVSSVQNAFNWFGSLASKASDVIGSIGSFLNPFDSGGYSFNSGGYGDVILNATFNVSQSNGNAGLSDMRKASRDLLNMIDEGLGRRVQHV